MKLVYFLLILLVVAYAQTLAVELNKQQQRKPENIILNISDGEDIEVISDGKVDVVDDGKVELISDIPVISAIKKNLEEAKNDGKTIIEDIEIIVIKEPAHRRSHKSLRRRSLAARTQKSKQNNAASSTTSNKTAANVQDHLPSVKSAALPAEILGPIVKDGGPIVRAVEPIVRAVAPPRKLFNEDREK